MIFLKTINYNGKTYKAKSPCDIKDKELTMFWIERGIIGKQAAEAKKAKKGVK